jgi:microsomal epoxide hydrolase
LSTGPQKDFRIADIARLMNELMVNLGFGDGYVAQGGDIGCAVSRLLGAKYPACKGSLKKTAAFMTSFSQDQG